MAKGVKTTQQWTVYLFLTVFGSAISALILFISLIAAFVNRGYTASDMSGFDTVSVWSVLLMTVLAIALIGVIVFAVLMVKHLKNTKHLYVKIEKKKLGQNRNQPFQTVVVSDKIKLAMQQINARASTLFSTNEEVSGVVGKLVRHMTLNGIDFTEKDAKTVLAALASSRLLLFKGEAPVARRTVRALGAFFGYELITQDRAFGYRSHDELVFNSGENVETDFAAALFQAVHRPDNVNLISLVGSNASMINLYFSRFLRYVKAPEYAYGVRLGKAESWQNVSDKVIGGLVELPPNIWFAISDKNAEMDEKYLRYAAVIDLTGKQNQNAFLNEANGEIAATYSYEGSLTVNSKNVISYRAFCDIVENCLENYSLELESWKKIDKLEEYLAAIRPFKIDNTLFRQMERYAAVLKALGADDGAILDVLIADKIVPLIADWSLVVKKDDEGLEAFIVNLLGEDNSVLTVKALKEKKLA